MQVNVWIAILNASSILLLYICCRSIKCSLIAQPHYVHVNDNESATDMEGQRIREATKSSGVTGADEKETGNIRKTSWKQKCTLFISMLSK